MFREAALVTASCVLFVQMGLSAAIQDFLGVKFRIASCPKCLTMWTCLATLIINGHGLLESVAASFLSAYAAVWLALVYDALAALYNSIYETIQEPDTPEGPGPDEIHEAADTDEVSKMQMT